MPTTSPAGANRRDGKKPGCQAPESREIVILDGVRHGLRAKTALLPFEDPAEFEALKSHLEAELRPCGVRELLAFDGIVHAAWLLQRARIFHTAHTSYLFICTHSRITESLGESSGTIQTLGVMLDEDARGAKTLEYISRMEKRFESAYSSGIRELALLQAARKAPAAEASDSMASTA